MLEEIKQQFDENGIEVNDEVLAKCMSLCIDYHMQDAAEFVEQWMAFGISAQHGTEPTVELLTEFERKVLMANYDKQLAASKNKPKYTSTQRASPQISKTLTAAAAAATSSLAIYGDDFMDHESAAADDVLDSYNVVHTPKAKRPGLAVTPRRADVIFSPASYSPITGMPRSQSAAAGSGKIVCTFGNSTLITKTEWKCTSVQQLSKIHIQPLLLHKATTLSAGNCKYMFDELFEMTNLAEDRLYHIGKGIHEMMAAAEQSTEDKNKLSQVQDNNAIGIICCDHDGGLDPSSVLLVSSDGMDYRLLRLSFHNAKSVALFPGQIVVLTGELQTRDRFAVEKIYSERQLLPPTPPKILEQLTFVVAAGPYTHHDDLVYEPLHDLLNYLKEHKPNVLILTGPFLHAEHALITELAESFESFFEKMIAGIVDIVGTSTTILLVMSHKDAHSDMVYPTPPVQLRKQYANVHVLPDPSMFDLNGLVIGITSTDIVDHMLSQELAINAGDKMKRIVSHLLNQGTFYPLSPPPDDKMSLDNSLKSKFANIEQMPHILILPSDQKYFMRVVNGCLAINPGRLETTRSGTFVRFVISPADNKNENNLLHIVGCQVRRV